jgi:hypothetical protein
LIAGLRGKNFAQAGPSIAASCPKRLIQQHFRNRCSAPPLSGVHQFSFICSA